MANFGSASIEIFHNDFGDIARKYPTLVSKVVRKTGFDIIRYATPYTPVDTGFLRMAVTVVMFTDLLVGVYWSAFYAIYQELGTRYVTGKFFATKAVEQARQPFIDAMQRIKLL